jgi:hypothetical protein
MRWSGFRNRMSDSAANRGHQKATIIFALKASPPNVFIGGPVPNPPGFPLKACGNECAREGAALAR